MLKQIDAFFDDYARRFNDVLAGNEADVDGTLNSFASCFVESSPSGVTCGNNDEQFRAAIPQGYAFYKSIGTQAMNIVSKDISGIDEMHALVKIRWNSEYRKQDGSNVAIAFDVFYFVRVDSGVPKIFAYITGDEQKALRENGLVA